MQMIEAAMPYAFPLLTGSRMAIKSAMPQAYRPEVSMPNMFMAAPEEERVSSPGIETSTTNEKSLRKHLDNKKEYFDLEDALKHLACVGEVEEGRTLKQEKEERERHPDEKKRLLERKNEEELRQQKLDHESRKREVELTLKFKRKKHQEICQICQMLEERKRQSEQEADKRLKFEKRREDEEIRRRRDMLQKMEERNRQMEENQRHQLEEFNRTMELMKETMKDEKKLREKEIELKMALLRKETETQTGCAIM